MTEPQISPLARRLAEENSIDWRVIPGTGPESRVIERDILTYLARIMSGEIDPPALPDASEPPAPGGTVPDLSEVSNLAAASAGMAKEGIDLSSLLGGVASGGVAPAASSFAAPVSDVVIPAPVFFAPVASEPVIPAPVIAAPVIPEPIQTAALDFQSSPSDALPSDALPSNTLPSSPADFTFSNEPFVPQPAFDNAALEQISFGDPTPVAAAFESPILFGDPTPVAPAVKSPVLDSVDAEFEIDLDDFDDAPAALEVHVPQVSAPQVSALEFSAPGFSAAQAAPSAYEADLVLDIDSTSEAPLTIAAMDASNEIDDNLVLADVSPDFVSFEPATFESFSPQPSTDVQPKPAPVSAAAMSDSIEHDDFEFDLIDTETLPTESLARATPMSEPVEVVAFTSPLEPVDSPELALSEPMLPAPAVLEMTLPEPTAPEPMLPEPVLLEPVLPEPVLPEPVLPEPTILEPTPPAPIAQIAQPVAALVALDAQPSPQPTTSVPPSTVASGFFQGFAVRRHFDASALTKIQHELTQSLNGREVPLEVFLARAAQRNLHALGIGDVVTLTRLGDTLQALQASGLHHSFIEAVQSVARATPGTMQGLLILDASNLGADDLVLPVDQPVLTLNVKGEYGHLTLAGNLPMSKAADFLGKVASALEIPVSLVI